MKEQKPEIQNPCNQHQGIYCTDCNMSLRDWFAGQVLAICPRANDGEDLNDAYDLRFDIAKFAYDIADAMIAQRGKQEEKKA
jgi:hypothetical protein